MNCIKKGERELSLLIIVKIAVALNVDEKELYEVKMMNSNIEEKIELARKILYSNIENYGIESDKTQLSSIELDRLLNIYYNKNKI